MYDKDHIEMLREVEAECNRFKKRLTAAINRIKKDDFSWGCKETGALKRAALDLKSELTRITQNRE
jgi:hypothetical protein